MKNFYYFRLRVATKIYRLRTEEEKKGDPLGLNSEYEHKYYLAVVDGGYRVAIVKEYERFQIDSLDLLLYDADEILAHYEGSRTYFQLIPGSYLSVTCRPRIVKNVCEFMKWEQQEVGFYDVALPELPI